MIKENVQKVLSELPEGVELEAAVKSRTTEEIIEAINAGVRIIGENYVQEAERAFEVIGNRARRHFIGHLQKNKIKKAVKIFDMIETIDSIEMAQQIDKVCSEENKLMQVLIEINSGTEKQKFGVLPEDTENLIIGLSSLDTVKVMGLMTMGPITGDAEGARPYFITTKRLFDSLRKANIPNVDMKYLSMGMSNSYKVAIEEGANIIRIGTKIFGERLK